MPLGQIDAGGLLSERKTCLFPYRCPHAWVVGIGHLMEDGSCSKVKQRMQALNRSVGCQVAPNCVNWLIGL